MTKEMKLIYDLMGEVIEHNEKTGSHIFIHVSPHVSSVSLYYYKTPGKKYNSGADLNNVESIIIFYDNNIREIKEQIKKAKKILFK